MSYRNLGDIDTAILRATIHEAGLNIPNHFSTQVIAHRCGISEYVIFSHFQTKENLLAKADEMISQDYYEAIHALLVKKVGAKKFFFSLLDFLISHPDNGRFAINYCRVFPQAEKAIDFDLFQQNAMGVVNEIMMTYQKRLGHQSAFALWCVFTRELICYAQYFIDQKLPDTPEVRETMYRILFEGIHSYAE